MNNPYGQRAILRHLIMVGPATEEKLTATVGVPGHWAQKQCIRTAIKSLSDLHLVSLIEDNYYATGLGLLYHQLLQTQTLHTAQKMIRKGNYAGL